jgi:hypothetical protein
MSVVEFSLGLWNVLIAASFTFAAFGCWCSGWRIWSMTWCVSLIGHMAIVYGIMADWAIVGMLGLLCLSIVALMWHLNGVEGD